MPIPAGSAVGPGRSATPRSCPSGSSGGTSSAGPGAGSGWYLRLACAARDRGAAVLDARKLVGQGLDRYVHRIADGTVVQPYRAVLALGSLAGDRTIVAIGQSRHLGGGLLVPLDVPLEDSEPAGGRA